MEKIVEGKTWEEFRDTGLLLFINQFLHIFGWSIVLEISDEDGSIVKVFPARVKFRGFKEKSVEEAYKKITDYMENTVVELQEDIQ